MPPVKRCALLKLKDSPVGSFFRAGLRVCLGTDDPQFHNTAQPLVEEYILSQKIFSLTTTDLCEIAQNSVINSNFSHSWKKAWLGDVYHKPSYIDANDIEHSNLGSVRPSFREDQLQRELNYIVTHADLERSHSHLLDIGAVGSTVDLCNRKIMWSSALPGQARRSVR